METLLRAVDQTQMHLIMLLLLHYLSVGSVVLDALVVSTSVDLIQAVYLMQISRTIPASGS